MADAEKRSEEAEPVPKPTTQTSTTKPVVADEDSDPDFDDLDDVLDQFSANAPTQANNSNIEPPSQSIPNASGPGRPLSPAPATAPQDEPALPSGQRPDESESEFIERLSKEMSAMFNTFAADPSKTTQSPEDMAKIGKELEAFTSKMEQEGIQPEDLLRAILGEEEGGKLADLAKLERESQQITSTSEPLPQSVSKSTPTPTASTTNPSSSKSKPQPKSFEDTIRNTMSRLGESDKSATTATQKSTQKSEEDILADMLRALDSGPSGSTDGDDNLSKMFMDMMQQLTHKDLLYEPMRELNDQYPTWLAANKPKLPTPEFERYSRQSVIVREITAKFEEPSFSDDDPACKEFVWERMQKMQDEGAPPEELVKNPLPGTDFGSIPGMGGGGGDQLPEGLSKELEEGCPTQ